MFLIQGKYKLIAVVTVVVLCALGSWLIWGRGKHKQDIQPPVHLESQAPTGAITPDPQPNQSKSANQSAIPPQLTPPVTRPTPPTAIAGPKLSVGEYYQQAMEYKNQGRYTDAVNSYKLAIEASPNETMFYQEKAKLEFMMTKKDEAIKTCQDGLKINPNDQMLQNQLNIYQASR